MNSLNLTSCRMCLQVPCADELVFSVHDTYQTRVLSELIYELFAISVTAADKLSSVCLECVNRIHTVQKIYTQFTAADEELQKLLEGEHGTAVLTSPSLEAAANDKCSSDAPQSEDSSDEQENESIDEMPVLDSTDTLLEYFEIDQDAKATATDQESEEKQKVVPITPPKHKCYFCGYHFETEIAFTQHVPQHFSQVPYVCHECDGLVFKTVRQASKHIALHNETERPYKCRICNLRFPTRPNSLTHERKMHRWKLKNKGSVATTRQEQQTPADADQQCSTCGQLFPHKADLRQHETSAHGGLRTHRCEICCRKFSAKKNLTRHLMIHSGEMPYKCTVCMRAFRQAGELKDHNRVHTQERPYACTQCDKRYRNSSMLANHRKSAHPATALGGQSERVKQ